MTTPIETPTSPRTHTHPLSDCNLPPTGWTCSRPTGHDGPCAATPDTTSSPVTGDTMPPGATGTTPSKPRYGFARGEEFDLALPSGGLVRFRRPTLARLLGAGLADLVDGFTSDLLNDAGSEEESATQAFGKLLLDDTKRNRLMLPLNKVAAIAVICPAVVLTGESTDEQINADDIDIPDKMAIFYAAIGDQLDALKSVQPQPETGLRDLPAGQDVPPTAQ